MSDWRTVTLGDVAAVRSGYPFKSKEWTESGIPVVKVANVKGGRLEMARCSFVSEATAKEARDFELKQGDILIAMTGYIGEVALVRQADLPCVLNQRVGRFVVTEAEQLDAEFLYAFLSAPTTRQEIKGLGYGSAQPNVSPALIHKIKMPLPPVRAQRGIAATLGALDDKIESNRRVVDVEFLLAIATLSGEAGTRVRVGDVAAVGKGLSYKGSGLDDGNTPGAREMVNLANFTTSGQMKVEGLKHYTGDYKAAHVLSGLESVVANTDLTQSREILGRGFLVPPKHAGSIHTHHTSVLRFDTEKEWMKPFLWAQLQSNAFRDRAKGFATGTTVTALPAEALLDFEFVVPADPAPIAERALASLRHAWQLTAESQSLMDLRDALLPELLSGRIRVLEADEAVAGVHT